MRHVGPLALAENAPDDRFLPASGYTESIPGDLYRLVRPDSFLEETPF